MSLTFTGKKRIRRSFGRIPEVVRMPNLIEVQKSSYDQFLQKNIDASDRLADDGMNGVFNSVFPVRDFSDRAVLEYVSFVFETPKFDEEECQQRDITFARKCTVHRACFSTMIKAKATALVNSYSLPVSFRIAALGLISNLTPKTFYTRVLTAAVNCQRRQSFMR